MEGQLERHEKFMTVGAEERGTGEMNGREAMRCRGKSGF